MSEITINRIKLIKHPFIKNIYVSKSGKIFNKKIMEFINQDQIDYPIELITNYFKNIHISEISPLYLFDSIENTINDQKITDKDYKNFDLINFPSFESIKYFHPVYKSTYVDYLGNAYKINEKNSVPISIENNLGVKFFCNQKWNIMSKRIFVYECFNQRIINRETEVIDFGDEKNKRFKFMKFNLKLGSEKTLPEGLIKHPYFEKYLLDPTSKDIYSSYKQDKLYNKSNLLNLFDEKTKRTIYYDKRKFIYEALNSKLLNENEYMVGNKLIVHENDPNFTYRKLDFKLTQIPFIYKGNDKTYFNLKYNKLLTINEEGKINIGSAYHPNFINPV